MVINIIIIIITIITWLAISSGVSMQQFFSGGQREGQTQLHPSQEGTHLSRLYRVNWGRGAHGGSLKSGAMAPYPLESPTVNIMQIVV